MKTFTHVCQHMRGLTAADCRTYAESNQDRVYVGKAETGSMSLLCCEQCHHVMVETMEKNKHVSVSGRTK
jgi:hypothetical protein